MKTRTAARRSGAYVLWMLGGSTPEWTDAEAQRAEAMYLEVCAREQEAERRKAARRALASSPRPRTPQPRTRRRARRTSTSRCRTSTGDDDGGEPPPPAQREVRWAAPTGLTTHPAAALVPEATDEEYAALKADIARDGVSQPLLALGTVVLDGRHRLRAALELQLSLVPVVQAVLRPDESAEAVMLRTALHRRQLSDDQRALMAARWLLGGGQ